MGIRPTKQLQDIGWTILSLHGYYTFEVHYKFSSYSISVAAGTDYQTAILQVMWFTDAHAVSDGVRCYPRSYQLNKYNVFSLGLRLLCF